MDIICFGDSNTYGWDPREFSTNRYDVQWPQLLQEMTGHHVVNMGQPGREIYHRDYQYRWFDDYVNRDNHELLIIMLGSNDILNAPVPQDKLKRLPASCGSYTESDEFFVRGIYDNEPVKPTMVTEDPESGKAMRSVRVLNSGAARVLERMAVFLGHIKENRLSDNILVISPPAMKMPDVWYNEAVLETAAKLGMVCQSANVRYADSTAWDIPLAFDGIHFTEEGHRIFAANVMNIIQ